MSIQIRVLESSDTDEDIVLPTPQEAEAIASVAEHSALRMSVIYQIEYAASCGQKSCTYQTLIPDDIIEELESQGYTIKRRGIHIVDTDGYDVTIHHDAVTETHWICAVCGWDITAAGYAPNSDEGLSHDQDHILEGKPPGWNDVEIIITPAYDETVHHKGDMLHSRFLPNPTPIYDIYW